MNAPGPSSAAREINRLHAEVIRLAEESQQSLHAALAAAWRAGQLLLEEKKRVRRTMGNAWLPWIEHNFRGSLRTAQNYMRLAQGVADVSFLEGMSLRQAYIHLGISTAPKSDRAPVKVEALPPHVRYATRLVRVLNAERDFGRLPVERLAAYRQDLRPLYEQLRRLFEPTVNNRRLSGSNCA